MKSHSILIVDDSPEIVNALSSLLNIQGYQTETALSGREALRKARKKLYDIVVCDIEMPGINGLEFLERIRRDGHDQEVILMTGYMEQEYFIQAIRLGASDFFTKPIDIPSLMASIEAIAERINLRHSSEKILNTYERAEFSVVIDPAKFTGGGLNKIIRPMLLKNLDLPQDLLNDIITCADEMLQNAYFHGVLELTPQERLLDQASLRGIIEKKLQEPDIASRRMRFSIYFDSVRDAIVISMEDDGNGFDHENWLQKLKNDGIGPNIDAHGRGLAMLYYLSDELEFKDGGRKIQLVRNLNNRVPGA